jgi:hypothetical protein
MTFSTDFSKSLKAISQDFKATANQMITNCCTFSIQSHTVSATKDDETIFPNAEDLSNWMKNFMEVELKPKPLNQKALEEMAKKGIQPKKQITDIILVCIIPSNTHIHVAVYVPSSSEMPVKDFVSNSLSSYNGVEYTENQNYAYAWIPHPDSLKERDTVMRYFFTELKKRNIYVEEEEDDEIVNYLD